MLVNKIIWLLLIILISMAGSGYGRMQYSVDEPDSGMTASSFVDILYNDGTIWLASNRGLSYSEDGGQTWYSHSSETGLNSNEPSAILGLPGKIWVANSHTESNNERNNPFGDGFNTTIDNGLHWDSITPPEASGYGKLAYDIATDGLNMYAACFYGGLIVSHDVGRHWSHMFYSPFDSIDWFADEWANGLTGRYFSCLVDNYHADTTIIYGGSAKGLHKFLRIPTRSKLGGNNITSIVGSDEYIYIANENGVTQADSALGKFYTSDSDNGLPSGNWIKKMAVFGDKIWAAPFGLNDTSGLGLYYTVDINQPWAAMDSNTVGPSDLWTKLNISYFDGPGSGVYDFKAYYDSTFYIASGDSGIFRSIDSGMTWSRFFVDSTDMDFNSLRNQVLSIDVTGDSLFLGTRAGLVKAAYIPPFEITFDTLVTFVEDDSTGSVVSIVRHHEDVVNTFTWIAVEPLNPDSNVGNYAAIQLLDGDNASVHVIYGTTTPIEIYDIAVKDSFTTFATYAGLIGNYNYNVPTLRTFTFTTNDTTNGRTMVNNIFYTANWINGKLFAGSDGGFGYRINNNIWRVYRTNTYSNKHDLAVSRTVQNSGLPGDWVVALDLQETSTDTLLWAACRSVPDTIVQHNAVGYSSDFGDSWTQVLTDEQIWNFAFDNNGVAYAAASSGLYYAPNSPDEWMKAEIIDANTIDTIWDETEIYSVEVVDTILWVGTSFGLAFRPIGDIDDWNIIRVFKPTDAKDDVFAAPVPFSPLNPNGRLTLHYRVEQSAYITIEIYDFAMNLVKVVTENRFRDGGSEYFEGWDGYNEEDDIVATGMYFFRVSYSTGEEYWGRLAIIP